MTPEDRRVYEWHDALCEICDGTGWAPCMYTEPARDSLYPHGPGVKHPCSPCGQSGVKRGQG